MQAGQIKLALKPQEFFKEKISSAASSLKVNLDEHVEFYLVNLLCEFIEPSKMSGSLQEGQDILGTPLAFMLKQALEAPKHQRLKLLRCLGDTSLYVSGFFQDYFNRKSFDITYYIDLGASAYQQVAELMRQNNKKEGGKIETFHKMSQNFLKLVDIVAEVSEGPHKGKSIDVLNIYDRWNRCQSQRLRTILEEQGIHPIPVPFKIAN